MTPASDGKRITLEPAALAEIKRQTDERQAAILAGLLQVPDYPPLPTCPECQAEAAEISACREFLTGDLLLNFSPCGHRFRG